MSNEQMRRWLRPTTTAARTLCLSTYECKTQTARYPRFGVDLGGNGTREADTRFPASMRFHVFAS